MWIELNMTYTLLTRAKKNIGDFLIFDRAKKLISHFKKSNDYRILNAWEPLDDHLNEINDSDAIIICGGPGIQRNFYPGIYPLTKNLDDIEVPFVLLGTGWSAFPGDELSIKQFHFSKRSIIGLKKMLNSFDTISCRDYLTTKILENEGVTKTLMSGCPAWYDLNYINKPFNSQNKINRIVFTPAQKEIYHKLTISIMEMLTKIFAKEKLYCSFHRGLYQDKYTNNNETKRLDIIKRAGEKLGYEIVNAAYDLSKIKFYEDCDLHVGFRLHGHIHFLSQRKPSFLLHEDSRGRGFSEAIGLPGIQAWEYGRLGKLSNNINILKSLSIRANSRAKNELKKYLENEIKNEFIHFKGLENVFIRNFETMKQFISIIP
jgi:hypothetical protein